MTQPETVAYLAKALQMLKEARIVAANDLAAAAGRSAYLAAYHAAQAFIFEHTGRAAKSHNGVRSEFARPVRDDPRLARRFVTFLARAYNLRQRAEISAPIMTRFSLSPFTGRGQGEGLGSITPDVDDASESVDFIGIADNTPGPSPQPSPRKRGEGARAFERFTCFATSP